jgi:hypothetical protein
MSLPIVNSAAVTREVENDLPLANDTRVFDAMAFNPETCMYDIWRGTATLEAIRGAGCRPDPASWGYYPQELLMDGWALRARPRG